MAGLFVDTAAASAAADDVRAAGADRAAPLIPAIDAGNGAATEALALVAAAVTSFHASFAVQTAVVATAVSLGVADTVAADGTTAR